MLAFLAKYFTINWKTAGKTLKDAVLVAAVSTIATIILNALPVEVQALVAPKVQVALDWLYTALGVSVVANHINTRPQ